MKRLFAVLFIGLIVPALAFAAALNTYLRLDDSVLMQSVSDFNNELKRRGIFERYGFEPFLNHYPLHATLYLAQYQEEQVNDVIDVARQLACSSLPVQLEITGMSLTDGNYVMLDINNATKPENPPLQQLSDKATLKLAGLRDYNAPIPDWAKSIPVKRRAFEHYGSPNVFFEFNPHLSLMVPQINDKERAQSFHNEVQSVINVWNFPHLTVESTVLGIGYTNEQGQIIEEIAHFNLSPCQN